MRLHLLGVKRCVNVSRIFYLNLRSCHNGIVGDSRKWSEPQGYDTDINIYNTVCRKKVKFKTKLKGTVSWYACGPTVYDSAHIGHACCYLYQDIIRRVMEDVFNVKVMMVMGVTDIDDKIIAAASAQDCEFSTLSRNFEKEFFSDLGRLNIKAPTMIARVTDYIPQIINFVDKLIEKGYGYSTPDGSVYFRVNNYAGYGKLNPADSDEIDEVDLNQSKESRKDFALWKGAKQGEPFWMAPWGPGRPGWHIECSAIASWLLGNEIDLHSGGVDLIFPHHENEEAQSCCHHDVNQWINYWLHTGHLRIGGDVKMSKSLKNTISISEWLKKYSSMELRMFCLLTKYRNGIEYSDKAMKNAVSVSKKFDNFLNDCEACLRDPKLFGAIDEPVLMECLDYTEKLVVDALRDDFDTPHAVSHLIHLISTTNKMLHNVSDNGGSSSPRPLASLYAVSNYVRNMLSLFGCSSHNEVVEFSNLNSVLDLSVKFRSHIRKAALKVTKGHPKESIELKKELLNFCDNYRQEMLNDGIELKDHGDASTWNIVKKMVKV